MYVCLTRKVWFLCNEPQKKSHISILYLSCLKLISMIKCTKLIMLLSWSRRYERVNRTALAALAVRGCGKISRPANCPALEDQKPGIVPGFLDPSALSRGAADYQSGGRASGRFLRQPLSQMSQVLNRESVLCQIENDEKQLAVTTMLEKGKKLEKRFRKKSLRNFAGAHKSGESNCHFRSISSTIRLKKSSGTIRSRNLREIAFPRISVYTYKSVGTIGCSCGIGVDTK